MTLIVNELFKETGSINKEGFATKRYFLVENASGYTKLEILQAAGVPVYGSLHPSGLATVDSKDCSLVANSDSDWEVTVNYAPIKLPDEEPPEEPPTERDRRTWLPKWSKQWIEVEKIPQKDLDGKAIVASSGEPVHITEYKERHKVITLSCWAWRLNESTLDDYDDSINSATWWGFAANTWKLNIDWESEEEQIDGYTYMWWRLNFRWEHNPNTWLYQPVDMGYCKKEYIGAPVGKYVQKKILDANGIEKSTPSFLDGSGSPKEIDATGQPVGGPYLLGPFRLYEQKNWATLFTGASFSVNIMGM